MDTTTLKLNALTHRVRNASRHLVNEYVQVQKMRLPHEKVLVKMFGEISQQTLLLGEQNAQMDRNQKGLK